MLPGPSNAVMAHALAATVSPTRLARAYDSPVHPASDEALARRAAGGDAEAFEQLVIRHQHKLYTLALRVTGSDADARDCVQEGLLAAWRSIGRFRGDARFATWVYRIVLRKAYDSIEARSRRAEPVDDVQAVAPQTDPGHRSDLLAALDQLDPEFRVVAVACDILGMSMDEAGRLLDLPAGTVKSRLHRARARLADALRSETAS
jgi:RNA polymerase sigma-70 factor, ECF subfamily